MPPRNDVRLLYLFHEKIACIFYDQQKQLGHLYWCYSKPIKACIRA
jgi:hypothetical protein